MKVALRPWPERRQATRTYEAARAQGQIAALLTQERPNLFTQSVANREPNAAIDVTLHDVQRLSYDGGGYEVVFPMVAGPRYVPAAAASKADPAAVQPAVLPAAIERAPGAPSRARVQIAPDDTIPNKDFVLRYQVAGAAPAFGALAYRGDPGKDGSFVLVTQPPAAAAPAQIAPREIVFVLDTSSSMRGAPSTATRSA